LILLQKKRTLKKNSFSYHRAASEGVAESSALHGEQKQASKADELHCGLNEGNLPCRCSKK